MSAFRTAASLAVLLALTVTGCVRDAEGKQQHTDALPTTSSSAPLIVNTSSETSEEPSPSSTEFTPVARPCDFRPTPVAPAAKAVSPPPNGLAPVDPPTTTAVLKTSQGPIPLTLTSAKTPCTVLNFLALASQRFYDGTRCHRLTSGGLSVLQCGDPTATGEGGPGYSFADEYPIGARTAPTGVSLYTRGVLAMANAGPDTNGSQFFLVYQDSQLQPNYTIFGTIDEPGLAVLDKIAAGGIVSSGPVADDGAPKTPVQIFGVQLP